MKAVMDRAMKNIEKSQRDDMQQMLNQIKGLHANQGKLEELMLSMRNHVKDLRGETEANAKRALQEMTRIAATEPDPRKSMIRMKPHLRTLASINSSSVIIPFEKLAFTEGKILGRGAFGEVKEAMFL